MNITGNSLLERREGGKADRQPEPVTRGDGTKQLQENKGIMAVQVHKTRRELACTSGKCSRPVIAALRAHCRRANRRGGGRRGGWGGGLPCGLQARQTTAVG